MQLDLFTSHGESKNRQNQYSAGVHIATVRFLLLCRSSFLNKNLSACQVADN